MNRRPKWRRLGWAVTASISNPLPSSPTSSCHLRSPSGSSVTRVRDPRAGCARVLGDVAQRLLGDAQHDRPRGVVKLRAGCARCVTSTGRPVRWLTAIGAVAQCLVEPLRLAERRTQLVDVAAQRVQLALEDLRAARRARPRRPRGPRGSRARGSRSGRSRWPAPGPARRAAPRPAASAPVPAPRGLPWTAGRRHRQRSCRNHRR